MPPTTPAHKIILFQIIAKMQARIARAKWAGEIYPSGPAVLVPFGLEVNIVIFAEVKDFHIYSIILNTLRFF